MPVASFSWCPFLELLFVYCTIFYQGEKKTNEIQFHENAVAIMLRRTGGRQRDSKLPKVYLVCRYIFKVLLHSD